MKLFLILLLAAGPSSGPAPEPSSRGDLSELVDVLKTKGDNAEPSEVRDLAELRSREALEALIDLYEHMNSIYLRRSILQGVAIYDQIENCEQLALSTLRNVATDSTERELREIAVDLIAGCQNFGKENLRSIVDSAADEAVRVQAMEHHTGSPRKIDFEWYRSIYKNEKKDEEDDKKRKKKRKGTEEEKKPHALQPLREMAFEAIVSDLDIDAVLSAAEDRNRKIRVRAIEEAAARGSDQTVELAEGLLAARRLQPGDRLAGAEILAREVGLDMVEEFIDLGTKRDTPGELAFGLADLVADLADAGVHKSVVKKLGKGKEFEKLFYLRAGRSIDDAKVDKALLKMLRDKSTRVQRLAMELLAERRTTDAVPELERVVEKSKDIRLVGSALDALSSLNQGDPAWRDRLLSYAEHEFVDIRNAAIRQLGKAKRPEFLDVITKALDHGQWSTRLAAAKAIEEMRVPAGVGALCRRIPNETGRMAVELSDILWNLTGQPFGANTKLWEHWWDKEGETFEIISASELRKRAREREERRLRATYATPSSFFGIRIVSERVIFVLDVSRSMLFLTRGEFVGEQGQPRIELAVRELSKCLDGLKRESFFNMIVFSDDVGSWLAGVSEASPAKIGAAKQFLKDLNPWGGTNMFGGLRAAFEDPDVDTIYLVSDGEPSLGEIIDPIAIREEIQDMNEDRGIIIHCIAVGEALEVLKWLAEDSGGSYVRFN